MINRTVVLAAAFAALSTLSDAGAAFTYVSTPTLTSITGGSLGGSTLTLTGVSSTTNLTAPTNINLFNVALRSTTTTGTDTFTANFSHTLTLTNVPPPGATGTGSVTFTGSLVFTRSDATGSLSTLSPIAPISVTADGITYTLSSFTYAAPTTGNTAAGIGNVSATISAAAVPEPASFAMLGLGLAGVGGLTALRRRREV